MNKELKDTMNCDMETGICEIPHTFNESHTTTENKPVKLLYFTDPICSSCWGIEPQLRKLKQEYGHYFNIEYRMGGLLKNWKEYGGSDVNGPESVAKHWNEAGAFYQMPIDGDLWKEDPLHSSYPPAIAFKAAQLQGNHKANRFLRKLKEMVFVEKKNITKMEHLLEAAVNTGLDIARFKIDYADKARQLFEEDLALTGEWGVRGFPTIYFIDGEDNRFKVYGSKPYEVYQQALLKLIPGEVEKIKPSSYEAVFDQYDTVTSKEFAVFYDVNLEEAEDILKGLEKQKKVTRTIANAGSLWKINS